MLQNVHIEIDIYAIYVIYMLYMYIRSERKKHHFGQHEGAANI